MLLVRRLALVLVLAVSASFGGLAEDVAFHGGHAAAAAVAADAQADAADPGLACHLHCGCHQAAPVVATATAPPCLDAAPPVYARLSERASSVASDRLPRPPRA